MHTIATNVDDCPAVMADRVAAEKLNAGKAMTPYFYRSHVVYEKELDEVIYKSWLYAGHVSQIPAAGDYFQFEIGEDALLISRDTKGDIHALMNICRHRGSGSVSKPVVIARPSSVPIMAGCITSTARCGRRARWK